MDKNQYNRLIAFFRKNPGPSDFSVNNESAEFNAFIISEAFAILNEILTESDSLYLCMKFASFIPWVANIPKDIKSNMLALGTLFNLIKVGVPLSEMPGFEKAVLIAFRRLLQFQDENIQLSAEFINASELNVKLRSKFRNDPRFKKIFDDAAWGWS